jgi:hypothetical protein
MLRTGWLSVKLGVLSYPALIQRIRAKAHSEEAIEHGPWRPADTLH